MLGAEVAQSNYVGGASRPSSSGETYAKHDPMHPDRVVGLAQLSTRRMSTRP